MYIQRKRKAFWTNNLYFGPTASLYQHIILTSQLWTQAVFNKVPRSLGKHHKISKEKCVLDVGRDGRKIKRETIKKNMAIHTKKVLKNE